MELADSNCYEPPPEIAAWLDRLVSPRIMDLGANIGLFGLYVFGRWPNTSLTAFEPDPSNATLLRRTIDANDLGPQWTVFNSACSNRAGTASFAAGLLSESRMIDTDDIGAVVVPMVDLLAEDYDVDLMKIDIEGAEWPIPADARMPDLKAQAIVLEWHTGGCPDSDPHTAAIRLLRDAGFSRTLDVRDLPVGADNGVTWAWRPEIAVHR